MVCAPDSGLSVLGSSIGWGLCVLFLAKARTYLISASYQGNMTTLPGRNLRCRGEKYKYF